MVVINIGMPRSGTLWRYNLIKALVIAAGGEDALQIREQYKLERFIGGNNADMNTLKAKRLLPAVFPSLFGKHYVLNTHARPYRLAKTLVRSGRIKAIYGYRDPRDCILSMLEYSERDHPHYSANFLNLKSVSDGIEFMQTYVDVWKEWTGLKNALVLRYEDMHQDFGAVVDRIIDYLELPLDPTQIEKIKADFLPRQKPKSGEHIHLEKGIPHRARSEFTDKQMAELNQAFASILKEMGYPQTIA